MDSYEIANSGVKKSGWGRAALWIVSVVLGLMFAGLGAAKLLHPAAAETFSRYGLPDWFRLVFGVAEIGGGLLLVVPRTATYGASVLGIVLAVVVGLLIVGEERSPAPPLILLPLVLLIGYARRPGAAAYARFMLAFDRYAEQQIAEEQHRQLGARCR